MVVGFVGEWMALLYEYDILLLHCATAVLYILLCTVGSRVVGVWMGYGYVGGWLGG